MSNSIKEQILSALGTRLATIRTANFYETEMGAAVLREFRPAVDQTKLPCVGFHPDITEKAIHYGQLETRLLPVGIQGLMEFGTGSPPELAEKMTADIEECVLSNEIAVGFNSGGTTEIVAGNNLIGETTGATAKVVEVYLASGAWGSGNASGTLTCRRSEKIFNDNEELTVGAVTGIATVDGVPTGDDAAYLSTGDLADKVSFASSKAIMPEPDGLTVGAIVVFHIEYKVVAGNPYSQTP